MSARRTGSVPGVGSALTIRLSEALHGEFVAMCRERDVSASQVLRAAMRSFVASRGEFPRAMLADEPGFVPGSEGSS